MSELNKTVTKLLNDIQRILKRNKQTVADLARDLGRDYHQVYYWVEVRRFNPQADGLLALMKWRDEHKQNKIRKKNLQTVA
jgi:hypothetical protein